MVLTSVSGNSTVSSGILGQSTCNSLLLDGKIKFTVFIAPSTYNSPSLIPKIQVSIQ